MVSETVLERLLRYVKIDTQSDPSSESTPSTQKQFDLANLLVKELKELGIENVEITDKCYVYAEIPSNIPQNHPSYNKVPKIGFIAHVDTSPDSSGKDVNPQIIENYQGGDIILPNNNVVIKDDPLENPHLKKCIGHTIVTTDGTTLLGSDDKSGVAGIMTMAQYFVNNPEVLHGPIGIAFTPDEEIGRGADHFDVEKFGCEYAFTLDGELPGEINKETFSADAAVIRCHGRDIHPGFAKDIMVNSMRAMADIVALFPKDMAPETTAGYEPYVHPHNLTGTIEKSELHVLLRAFTTDELAKQHDLINEIIEKVKSNYPKTKIEVEFKEYYRNMVYEIEKKPHGADYLFEAAERVGADPFWEPIRGGTDGSRLSYMGLPTPNIYTGGTNFHSKTEWVSINALELAVKTTIELVKIWQEKSK